MPGDLTVGKLVAHLRRERARMTQPQLAAELRRRWLACIEDADVQYGKHSPEVDAIRAALSEIENNKRAFKFPYTRLLAQIFELPDNVFSVPPKNVEALNSRLSVYDSERLDARVPQPTLSGARAVQKRFFSPQGLSRANPQAVFDARDELVERLNHEITDTKQQRVILLVGPSGIGKSTLLRRWFDRFAHKKAKAGFCIQCTDKSGELILDEIVSGLKNHGYQCGNLADADEILRREEIVIIFDGLGPNLNNDTSLLASQRTNLIQFIIDSVLSGARSKYALAYAMDLPNSQDLVSSLHSGLGGRVVSLVVPPLSDTEGDQYLRNLGIFASPQILERISESLGGNPTDLFAFAQSIPIARRTETEFVERLSFDIHASGRIDRERSAQDVFRSYMNSLNKDRHYECLLLLVLSLVREGILLDTCDKILKDVSGPAETRPSFLPMAPPPPASFLAKSSIQSLLRYAGGRVELHVRPRRIIAVLSRELLTPEQRVLIHLVAARALWRGLPRPSDERGVTGRSKYKPQETDVTALHDLIFHLTRIHGAFAVGASTPFDPQGTLDIAQALNHDISVAHAPKPWFNPASVIEFAYSEVLLGGIGDERHVITRQLGDYEQKLRIMSLFLEDPTAANDLVRPVRRLSEESKRRLVADVAICALRSGRLSLSARAAATQVDPYFCNLVPTMWENVLQAVHGEGNTGLAAASQALDRRSETLNTYSTVLIRQGRLNEAREVLTEDIASVEAAIPKLRVAMSRDNPARLLGRARAQLHGSLIAARRMTSKMAQIQFLQNDSRYKRTFGIALEIEGLKSNAILRGETGRTYCRAMLRNEPDNVLEPEKIIDNNLAFCQSLERYYEVLEWRIEEMCISRVQRKKDRWIDSLKRADSLLKSHHIGLSFSAFWELELEKIKGAIYFQLDRRNYIRVLENGVENLRNSGHKLLQLDSLLILAELDKRRVSGYLQNARLLMTESGYFLKRDELDRVERGESTLDMP